ncbi:MAG: DEAD/DEAH box helicase [Candidatus Andersenbacteria bacterium]|nr:DEAD/DEAH box helicase [Candidatus Andersenbacteria bacterium]
MSTFAELGLKPSIIAVLDKLKFTTPTPIQAQAIPVAVEGKDVIGIAQTGTGKTFAFSLPMIQQLAASKKQGLVILPTRELAIQVEEAIRTIGQTFGIRTAVLIGGASMYHQIMSLKRGPHVIIGTPGRINDHLEQKKLQLNNIGVLVLDEADRMLDMGFAPQINEILRHVPKERQTLLFSATMPQEIVAIATKYMKTPVRIEVARAGSVSEQVDQDFYLVSRDQKDRMLDKLLDEFKGTVLVFSRTKYGAKKICRAIKHMGHTTAEIHSNLSLSQRRRSLAGFKSGDFRVLVATDIAARGIDVTNIELVVNYDLPESPDDYVHRVGRTGRAGLKGKAVTFITPDQRYKLRAIERLVRTQLSISALPELPKARAVTSHNMFIEDDRRVGQGHRRATFKYARPQSHSRGPRSNRPSGTRNASGFSRKPHGSHTSSSRKPRVHL